MEQYIPLRTKVFRKPFQAVFYTQNNWRKFDEAGDAIFKLPTEEQYLAKREISKENIIEYHYLLKRDHFDEKELTSISGICVPVDTAMTPTLNKQLTELFESEELRGVDFVVSKTKIYPIKMSEQKPISYGYLIGEKNTLNTAHVQLTVLLQMHEGNVVEFVDLQSISFIPMIAGVQSLNLKNISTSFQTKVFLPNISGTPSTAPQVFLAGSVHALVLQAKTILNNMIRSIDGELYYSTLQNVSQVKLKYISSNYSKELNHLMMKYQTFIFLNTGKEEVEFQSSSTHLLEQVKKVFTMEILSDVSELQLIFHDGDYNTIEKPIPEALLDLSLKCNITLLVENDMQNFVFIGGTAKLERVLDWVSKNMQSNPVQVKYFVELDPSYKDFISGKKNGKISRIMDTTNVNINLDLQNGNGNMILTMFASDIKNAIIGQKLVSDELPSETSFFIPEAYHRPVIGTGGSVIQTIMRKHNVFIQFSNSFQLPQNKLAHIRYDNVVIRCPSKNRNEIIPAKEELNQLAQEYSEMQPKVQLKLTPGQYRYLLHHNENDKLSLADNIGIIERRTSTYIMFPFLEPKEGFLLEIRGNDNQATIAGRKLSESFGEELEITITNTLVDTVDLCNSIIVPFLAMDIIVTTSQQLIRFTYKEGNKSVTYALDILRDYLKKLNVTIMDKTFINSWIVGPTKSIHSPPTAESKKLTQLPNVCIQQYSYGYATL
ncbi:HFR041Cp [Eremothecium sinecaudum]|uniref:HFR041Cp n=1 Tax=Eremothecium sinecaudum TaxID=45286 RepID=A0A0X8HU65_9SACH|nr:HFR041Cp [Eremothecium sinecaudum]AMD21896.1 HFR041Cp [Eremothecium sinecaudum]